MSCVCGDPYPDHRPTGECLLCGCTTFEEDTGEWPDPCKVTPHYANKFHWVPGECEPF